MFFHKEPKKTKPPDLDPVCRDLCDKYEETSSPMGILRRMLLGNPFLTVEPRRCKHHPLYSDPDDPVVCPFAEHLGKTLMWIDCDLCGKAIKFLNPLSDEADMRMSNLSDEKKSVIDICDECRRKGL